MYEKTTWAPNDGCSALAARYPDACGPERETVASITAEIEKAALELDTRLTDVAGRLGTLLPQRECEKAAPAPAAPSVEIVLRRIRETLNECLYQAHALVQHVG